MFGFDHMILWKYVNEECVCTSWKGITQEDSGVFGSSHKFVNRVHAVCCSTSTPWPPSVPSPTAMKSNNSNIMKKRQSLRRSYIASAHRLLLYTKPSRAKTMTKIKPCTFCVLLIKLWLKQLSFRARLARLTNDFNYFCLIRKLCSIGIDCKCSGYLKCWAECGRVQQSVAEQEEGGLARAQGIHFKSQTSTSFSCILSLYIFRNCLNYLNLL